MLLFAIVRTAYRGWRGQRPNVEDMERIVGYIRDRRARGLSALPFGASGWVRSGFRHWCGYGPQAKAQGSAAPQSRAGSLSDGQSGASTGFSRHKASVPGRSQAIQGRALRRTVEYVYRYVPFYRETMDAKGVRPGDIRSLADVTKLPITYREQLADRPHDFISTYPGLVPAVRSWTSGTTRRPVVLYLTNEELRYYAALRALGSLTSGSLGPTDILQLHQSVDDSTAGIITAQAARLAGTLVLTWGDKGSLDEHLESIFQERHVPGKKTKVTALITSPSHLWALTHRAVEKGLDCRESGLRWISTGGAMVSDDLKQRVLDIWGIRLSEHYGLVEAVTAGARPCSRSSRLHFSDLSAYAEALHPEMVEPVPPGGPGILVITTFYPYRELMPLVRYWTGDLVRLSPDPVCVCGARTTQILDILGRADHMVTIGMYNYYPQQIGDPLVVMKELVQPPRFTLRTEMDESTQRAILEVEVAKTLSDGEQQKLRTRIERAVILSSHWEVAAGSVALDVRLRPAGHIERPFPYKR